MNVQLVKLPFDSITLKNHARSDQMNNAKFILKVDLMLKDIEEGWSLDDLFGSMGSVEVIDGPAKPPLVGFNPM